MDFYKKLGMYLFIVGSLLAVLAGAFPLTDDMHNFALIALVFLGVFTAILNITDDEEHGFLIASAAFLLLILVFKSMDSNPLFAALSGFFQYSTIFVGSMMAVSSLKLVVEYGSQNYGKNPLEDADEVGDHLDHLFLTKQEKYWNILVLVAVAISFIMVLFELFFGAGYAGIFFGLDILITIIFLIDLYYLYKKESSFTNFIKFCWLDIVATIPFYGILRIAKLARLMKFMKVVKLHKTLKFFSNKSGVREYIQSPGKNKAKAANTNKVMKKPTRKKK